jgi:hypothetical protein
MIAGQQQSERASRRPQRREDGRSVGGDAQWAGSVGYLTPHGFECSSAGRGMTRSELVLGHPPKRVLPEERVAYRIVHENG